MLILLVMLASTASFVKPVHAQGFSISLSVTTITAPMNSVVTDVITVTSIDGLPHTINLAISAGRGFWWPASFAPNPVSLPGVMVGETVSSTLTLPVPGPDNICPGEGSPGPYFGAFTVQGTDAVTGLVATTSLALNLLPITFPLSISIQPSKPSYRVGETVTLTMDSNLRAEYYLKVRRPDGTVWASAHAYLPATFTKAATEPLGTYTAELVAYYCGTAQATATFSVTPNTYDVTISLAGLPTDVSTALLVDGNKVGDMKGGDVRVLAYPVGTSHTFQVDQYASGAAGYRYYCASNSWTAGSEGSNVFNYVTQVYLDVSTDPAGVTDVTPSGWYSVGWSASIAEVATEVQADEGTKYVFKEWTVDRTSKAGNGFVVVMDAPHKVVAKFDTMFLFTVVSDYGNPKGSGYYKTGDTATFSVDSPVGIGIQHVFVEWKDDYSGKDPRGSILMDGPKKATAVWTTSYLQLYLLAGALVVIIVIVGLLLWRRRRGRPAALKPTPPAAPPPPPSPAETPTPTAAAAADAESVSKRAVSVSLRCTNCGHELKEGQVYCPECGQKVTD